MKHSLTTEEIKRIKEGVKKAGRINLKSSFVPTEKSKPFVSGLRYGRATSE